MYDCFKNSKKYIKNYVNKYLENFNPNIFEKLLFLSIFGRKMAKAKKLKIFQVSGRMNQSYRDSFWGNFCIYKNGFGPKTVDPLPLHTAPYL